MSSTRLSLALSDAPDMPAEGPVLVIGADRDTDLSFLPAERLCLVQGFRPDHDLLQRQGGSTTPQAEPVEGGYAAAILLLPRARIAGRSQLAQICQLCRPGAPVWIDGQKTDGIDTMIKDLRDRAEMGPAQAKAHGKIFRITARPDLLEDWIAPAQVPAPGFVADPASFSSDKVDHGSALLAAALPQDLSGRGADLGSGWGWLSAQILTRPKVRSLDMIEADHAAVEAARLNVTDPRARFHWADATTLKLPERMDFVVMNPPFHRGRAADPALGAAFIAAAADLLSVQGVLWMVANRHLPYEAQLAARFREVAEVAGDGGFKVIRASHPQRRPAAGGTTPAAKGKAGGRSVIRSRRGR